MTDSHPTDIEAVGHPLLQLDREGRVQAANRAAAALFGSEGSCLVGRDFFHEVAPSSARPGFYGRFLEGVRQGRFEERFGFVFGGEDQALRASVRLESAGPERPCWLSIENLEPVATPRGREAAEAVGLRFRSEPVDASLCEREPIHIPGAVQPHAALMVVDSKSLRVAASTDNLPDVVQIALNEAVGRPVGEVLPPSLVAEIQRAVSQGGLVADAPLRLETAVGPSATPAIVLAHQRDGRLLIEIEPAPVRGEDFGAPTVAQVTAALGRVGRSATLAEAAGAAAVVVRELTGFERVLVYRFDRDWNGVSVAEDRDPEAYDSLLDLYFPASDIPAQARALYARAPARFVFDRDYAPSPLVGDASLGNAPIDLSLVQARSLSPIHLEYQRNLGVNGSMSSSIMVDGRLWGLVIGHHRRPHYVAPETRAAVASATEALGLRIAALEIAESWRTQEAHVNAETLLLERMAGVDHPTEALLGDAPTMLELFGAGGAAFVEDRTVYLLGATPSREQVLDLTEWLVERGQVHASEQLSGEFPPAEAYRAIASGLLAAFTGGERPAVLLWFKPEEVSAIAWGGDPTKAVESTGAGVLPRRSFERWVEERRGASTPWAAWQVAAAGRIARAVENVARRHNRRVAVLRDKQDELLGALEQQKQLLHDKDLLTREIDHRVKNSLQIVASFVKMQSRATADAAARAGLEETYGRVMSVARIHDSLWRSDEVGEVDIGQTIAALCRDLSSMAGEGRSLEVTAGPDIRLPYQQALALSLITLELVTNAVKYAYGPEEAGKVEVDIRAQPEGGVCLTVSDRGRGLPADWAAGARESGLGMKLINAMLSQIKGEMRVETGAGARFVVCA